ncbi:peptidylprolyl isomerase [Paenibacillus sp. GD4]|uniref:peptidylprolyl isomerase n=1 Tax=Paenibacillus sp. GD4 TaxID=3068890 RepID=UPI002796B96B|nr:peptidylprolyl isomerase [Paenibacillus sp. GD4]MDQ1909330.1 peptidylprolyl isomerase [Paenibacillus sp. GD4]
MDTANTFALRINHRAMTLKQLLQRLLVDASLAAVSRCKEDLTMECWADTLGLTADTAALQSAVNRFRRDNGLFTTAQTGEWLERRSMSLDDLVALQKPQVLRAALARHTISDEDIHRHFLENASRYDLAEISIIVTSEHGVAQELLFRVEEGSDFHALAREYSMDDTTAKAGGYMGFVGREDVEPETAAAVFNTEPGSVLGPFERKRGHIVLLVEELYPAELNEALKEKIREELFLYKLEAYQRTLEIHEDLWSLGEG